MSSGENWLIWLVFSVAGFVSSIPILIQVLRDRLRRKRDKERMDSTIESYAASDSSFARFAFGKNVQTMDLPKPEAFLEVSDLVVVSEADSKAIARGITFKLSPGEAMGVIGPSGSGKTTICEALVANLPASTGSVRLGGASVSHFNDQQRPAFIGYLPQSIDFFAGTVAENIARCTDSLDAEKVVDAAKLSGAHDTILRLPNGYDTTIGNGRLSRGQQQIIALARAVYSRPAMVVLDEPTSSLDAEQSQAVTAAVRKLKENGTVVVIASVRPQAISEADYLLVLENGLQKAFGPRDEILKSIVSNAPRIEPAWQNNRA